MAKRPETEREKEMFEYYWSLGDNRKLTTVAKHFNCSYDTLKKISVRLKWSERLFERDKAIREEIEKRLANKIAKDLEKKYAQISSIVDKSFKNIKMNSFRDFKDFFETATKLRGDPQKFEIRSLDDRISLITIMKEDGAKEKEVEATTAFEE